MGTALTEQQLKELGRLTKRLWLAFDGDAAGETATLRGMELAVKQGFDVKVVALAAGRRPRRRPGRVRRAARRRRAVPALPRPDRDRARRGPRGGVPDGQGAARRGARLAGAAGRMAVRERQARDDRAAARRRLDARAAAPASQRVLDASAKLERNALAGVLAHPGSAAAARRADARALLRPGASHAARTHRRRRAARPGMRSGCWPSSTRVPSPRGSTTAPARSCCSGCVSERLRRELQRSDPVRAHELQEALQRLLDQVARLSSV